MALGAPLEEAVTAARDYVFNAIKTAPGLGEGNGPLNHGLANGEEPAAEEKPTGNNPFAVLKDV